MRITFLAKYLFCLETGLTFHASAQQIENIPLRHVVIEASSDSAALQNVGGLHARSDGRVLVADATARRLLLFEPTLKKFKVITNEATTQRFGLGDGGLLPFQGDSSAFIDRASGALVVVDQKGDFSATIAPSKVTDMAFLSGSVNGVPGFDVAGRLIYRGMRRPAPAPFPTERDTVVTSPDSAPILRDDLERRRLDTVAMIRVPFTRQIVRLAANGRISSALYVNPLPQTDDWAFYPDGTIAIVRGTDYHIDWVYPDGSRRSSSKMPFEWRRISDFDKERMVDSVQRMINESAFADSVRAARVAEARGVPAPNTALKGGVFAANELPDYYPAVRPSSQPRVDREGNLWIMPGTVTKVAAGSVFDVINRDGQIVERVQLPPGRVLQGFGTRGVIYLSVPKEQGWVRVEKGQVVRNAGRE